MRPSRAALAVCVVSAVSYSLWNAGPAYGALSASAVVSTSSAAAPFDYTVTLQNTGTTNIGTFWFAWTNIGYDYLSASPTGVSGPAGWVAPITHNFTGDGYGIEFYNTSGSAIAPGGSGLFHFTSADSPAKLAGPAYYPVDKVSTAFVYIGLPESDPGFKFNASVTTVPEPASLGLAGVGAGLACLGWRRRLGRSR